MAQQQLPDRMPIVKDDGTPDPYFIRFLQTIGVTVDGKVTIDQVNAAIDAWAANRNINTTSPLNGGGSLANDLTLTHNDSGVTPGTYGDSTHVPQITIDSKGHISLATLVSISGGGGSGGSLVLLEQHTASASASLNFTTSFTSTYDEYVIEFIDIVGNTNAVDFLARVSTNGGSTWDTTTNYQTAYSQVAQSGFIAGVGSAGDTGFILLNSYSTTTNNAISGMMRVFNPLSSSFKRVLWDTTALKSDNNFYRNAGAGQWIITTAVNAIQFLFRSGTITSGTIRIYGLSSTGGGGSSVSWKTTTATGTGASQNVTLSAPVSTGGILMVFVNGLKYAASSYTVSGTTLTLTTNASGDAIEVVWQ